MACVRDIVVSLGHAQEVQHQNVLGQLGSTCEHAQQPAWLLLPPRAPPPKGKRALPQQRRPLLPPWLSLWRLPPELPGPRWLPCCPPAPRQPIPSASSALLPVCCNCGNCSSLRLQSCPSIFIPACLRHHLPWGRGASSHALQISRAVACGPGKHLLVRQRTASRASGCKKLPSQVVHCRGGGLRLGLLRAKPLPEVVVVICQALILLSQALQCIPSRLHLHTSACDYLERKRDSRLLERSAKGVVEC